MLAAIIVTLPNKATKEQWSVVCRGSKRVKVFRAPCVETKNSFNEGKEKEVDMAGGGKKEGADAVTLPQGRVLVYGDTQVRHLVCSVLRIGSVGRGCICRMPG